MNQISFRTEQDFYKFLNSEVPNQTFRTVLTELFQALTKNNIESGTYSKTEAGHFAVTLQLKASRAKKHYDGDFCVPKTLKFYLDCDKIPSIHFEEKKNVSPSITLPSCCLFGGKFTEWSEIKMEKDAPKLLATEYSGPLYWKGNTSQPGPLNLSDFRIH